MNYFERDAERWLNTTKAILSEHLERSSSFSIPSSKKQMTEGRADVARKCILLLRKRIKKLCILSDDFDVSDNKPNNPVWIPYYEYL
jgi:hypothetical protein